MVRLSDEVWKRDVRLIDEKDSQRRTELNRERNVLALEHWDLKWKVSILRERVSNAALRTLIERGQYASEHLVTSQPDERTHPGEWDASSKAMTSLWEINRSVGAAFREYDWGVTASEPSWPRRQWDRLRGWRNREHQAGSAGDGEG
jgi:hypothetical protein